MKYQFDKLVEYIENNKVFVYDVCGYDGKDLLYKRINPSNDVCDSYSVSKTFTATAVGICIDLGLLTLETPVLPFFSEYVTEKTDVKWQEVKVKHLLVHSFGQGQGNMYKENILAEQSVVDWNERIFNEELSLKVGTTPVYSNAGCYLLAQIVEKVTGERFADFIKRVIFDPMDFRLTAVMVCPMNRAMAATGMYIRTEDLVKLGYAYANGGIYNGKRIFSEKWSKTATESYTTFPDGREYTLGCMWRLKGDYRCFADGANGQMILVDTVKGFSLSAHSLTGVGVPNFVRATGENDD